MNQVSNQFISLFERGHIAKAAQLLSDRCSITIEDKKEERLTTASTRNAVIFLSNFYTNQTEKKPKPITSDGGALLPASGTFQPRTYSLPTVNSCTFLLASTSIEATLTTLADKITQVYLQILSPSTAPIPVLENRRSSFGSANEGIRRRKVFQRDGGLSSGSSPRTTSVSEMPSMSSSPSNSAILTPPAKETSSPQEEQVVPTSGDEFDDTLEQSKAKPTNSLQFTSADEWEAYFAATSGL